MSGKNTDASLRDLEIANEDRLDSISKKLNGTGHDEDARGATPGSASSSHPEGRRGVTLGEDGIIHTPGEPDRTFRGIQFDQSPLIVVDEEAKNLFWLLIRDHELFSAVVQLCSHNDSSTGDVPAATGLTDRVGVAARRGDDFSPDGHANSTARIIRQLAELQRSVLDVLSWWDIVHGDPASDVAEGFLADAVAALRKEVRR